MKYDITKAKDGFQVDFDNGDAHGRLCTVKSMKECHEAIEKHKRGEWEPPKKEKKK